MSSIIAPKFVTRPNSSIRPNPNSNEAKLDRLNAIAQRKPLGQTGQRDLAYLQKKLGVTPGEIPPYVPQDTGMPKATPKMATELPASQIQQTVKGGPAPDYGSMTQRTAPTGGVAAPGTSNRPNAPLPPGATYKKGGKVSASSRADGIAQRGKTRGKYI